MPLLPSQRRLLLGMWALLCLGLLVRAFAGGLLAPVRPGPGPWRSVRVDINRAGMAELCTLPGIGQKRAEAIVLHRVRQGWFQHLEDLEQVDGLGPESVAELAPHAVVGAPATKAATR